MKFASSFPNGGTSDPRPSRDSCFCMLINHNLWTESNTITTLLMPVLFKTKSATETGLWPGVDFAQQREERASCCTVTDQPSYKTCNFETPSLHHCIKNSKTGKKRKRKKNNVIQLSDVKWLWKTALSDQQKLPWSLSASPLAYKKPGPRPVGQMVDEPPNAWL